MQTMNAWRHCLRVFNGRWKWFTRPHRGLWKMTTVLFLIHISAVTDKAWFKCNISPDMFPLFILIKNHFVLALVDNGCLMCSSASSDVTWGELSLPRLPSLIQLLNQRKWQHANSVGPEPCNLNLHTVSASLSVTRKENKPLYHR